MAASAAAAGPRLGSRAKSTPPARADLADMVRLGYSFVSAAARERWLRRAPCRVVSRELGYPVLVVDEAGEPVPPPVQQDQGELASVCATCVVCAVGATSVALASCTTCAACTASTPCAPCVALARLVARSHLAPVSTGLGVCGLGVFSRAALKAGELVGSYCGTVYAEEDWLEEWDDNFLFNLNDGANGVLLDGSSGSGVNALKFLNHGCAPNVVMREVFLLGQWHVLVFALADIPAGSELLHDFALHTEAAHEAQIPCLCGAPSCRGRLFRYFAW
jgi:hypothetical protein